MKLFFSWSNILNSERRDIVFEHRNKNYGGYVLRKEYQKHVFFALIISITGIGLAISSPLILSYLSSLNFEIVKTVNEGVVLAEPPPIDKLAPPPPPVIIPPPIKQTIKFTPPIVVSDDKADDPPPTQDEVKDVLVSTENRDGVKDLEELPTEPDINPDDGKIFTYVEEMPGFPGGNKMYNEYLSRHIVYPTYARETNVSGTVYLTFTVDKEGKIKDASVLRGIGGGCDEEALRVIRAMPDWRPGRQNGRNVVVRTTISVVFDLK